jgi:hypothetical protein
MSTPAATSKPASTLTSNLTDISNVFILDNLDPSRVNKQGINVLLGLGIVLPILLMLVYLFIQGEDIRTITIMYICLFLFGMALWYLIYSVRQYMAFTRKYKKDQYGIDIKLKL